MTDDSYARGLDEIQALRARLARLEAYATAQTEGDPVPNIIHADLADTPTREERRQRDLAAMYRFDPAMERLIGLAAKAEAGNLVAAAELAAMTPAERVMLGYHANSRAAAVAEHLISDATGEAK